MSEKNVSCLGQASLLLILLTMSPCPIGMYLPRFASLPCNTLVEHLPRQGMHNQYLLTTFYM